MYLATLVSPMVMPSLTQLPVDVGRAPERILSAHPPDQVANLAGNGRSTRLTPPNLPGPEEAKPLAMPRDDGLGLDDG